MAAIMLRRLAAPLSPLPGCAAWLRGLATAAAGDGKAGVAPRWYKDVAVVPNATEGEFLVQLDNRSLRTPARFLLAIPSYPLALAIAAEWQWQGSRIQPFTMPLMSLAATAIDQPRPRERTIEQLLQYLHTDALTCRHDREDVAQRQQQRCGPIVAWASSFLGAAFAESDSIFGAQQSDAAVAAVRRFLEGLSSWELAAVESLAGTCKSVLLGTAVFKGRLGVADAISLARLEEELQLEEWGYVEGGHDIDDADIRVRLTSASVFARLLPRRSSDPIAAPASQPSGSGGEAG